MHRSRFTIATENSSYVCVQQNLYKSKRYRHTQKLSLKSTSKCNLAGLRYFYLFLEQS